MNITALHPWNHAFNWVNAAPRSGFLTESQIDSYNLNGYFVAEDVIAIDQIENLTVE